MVRHDRTVILFVEPRAHHDSILTLCIESYLELNIFVINCSFAAISTFMVLSCSHNLLYFCITMIEKRTKYIGHTSYRRPSSSNVGLMFFALVCPCSGTTSRSSHRDLECVYLLP